MSFNDGFNIRAVPWPPNTPVSGNSLVYNGTQWVAQNVSGSGGGGTGDITSVIAGTNLTGGGTSGDVTVSLSASLAGIDKIDFTTGNLTNPPFQPGRLYYDINTFDLQYNTVVNDVSMNLGQQLVVKVKNDSLATINKGKLVRIVGGLGNNPTISTASWDSDGLSANTLGMMMNTVAHNDFGYVILNGVLIGVDTNSFSAGQVLYLSSSGNYTNVKPVAPKHTVSIGEVIRVGNSSVGSLFINISNGYEIGELHDVSASAAVNGDLLIYDSSSSIWKNTKTLSGSYTVTGSITASNFVGTLIGSMSSSLYNREWHVSNADGDDTTGNGTLLKPYKTITKAFQVVGNTGEQVVVHPGTYTTTGTLNSANVTVCAAQGSNGGEVYLSGAIVVSQSLAPASSIRFFGLSIRDLTHNGTGSLYIDTCKIDNFTKTSNTYCEINDSDINVNLTVNGSGILAINGGKQTQAGSFTINNASATVSVKNSINCTAPVVNAGFFGAEGSTIYSKATGYAVSASALTRVDLVNCYLITPAATPASASMPLQYSVANTVYNKTGSILGTSLNLTSDFQNIRADTITGSISGSLARFGTITGSNVTGSTARFTTISASNLSAAGTLQANNLDINGTLSILGLNPTAINVRDLTNTTDIFSYNTALEQLQLLSSVSPSAALVADATFVNVSDSGYIAQMLVNTGAPEVKLELYVSASSGVVPVIEAREGVFPTATPVPLKLDASEIDVNSVNIINVAYPTTGSDAANKQYVDDSISGSIPYAPTNTGDWSAPAPTTVGEALDRIAVLLKALNGGTGP